MKWFNPGKGYGFISQGDSEPDVFFHQTVIHANGFRGCQEVRALPTCRGSLLGVVQTGLGGQRRRAGLPFDAQARGPGHGGTRGRRILTPPPRASVFGNRRGGRCAGRGSSGARKAARGGEASLLRAGRVLDIVERGAPHFDAPGPAVLAIAAAGAASSAAAWPSMRGAWPCPSPPPPPPPPQPPARKRQPAMSLSRAYGVTGPPYPRGALWGAWWHTVIPAVQPRTPSR